MEEKNLSKDPEKRIQTCRDSSWLWLEVCGLERYCCNRCSVGESHNRAGSVKSRIGRNTSKMGLNWKVDERRMADSERNVFRR